MRERELDRALHVVLIAKIVPPSMPCARSSLR